MYLQAVEGFPDLRSERPLTPPAPTSSLPRGLVSTDLFSAHQHAPREAERIHARSLICSPSRTIDLQNRLPPIVQAPDVAHTGGILRVCLGNPPLHPVPFGAATAGIAPISVPSCGADLPTPSGLYSRLLRHAADSSRTPARAPGRAVDGREIPQWTARLFSDCKARTPASDSKPDRNRLWREAPYDRCSSRQLVAPQSAHFR